MATSKQVGAITVTLNFNLMCGESQFELMAPDDEEVILASNTLSGMRDLIAEKLIDADIHNFKVEVNKS